MSLAFGYVMSTQHQIIDYCVDAVFVFDMLVGDAFQKEKITFGTLEAFIAKLDADYPQCGEACSLPVEHASYADLAKRVKELEESVAHIEQFLADATTNRQPSA